MLDDNGFRELLHHLHRPWKGYRKVRKGVMRRLRGHMEELGCATVACYIGELQENPAAYRTCQAHLQVSISRFFRDRQVWHHLENSLLPELASRFPRGLQAWSAGCACGEEAYSLAILRQRLRMSGMLQIMASDADPVCLERARRGVYPRSSLREISEEGIAASFMKQKKNNYGILDHLKRNIDWRQHDLLGPPPGAHFHIILLRNNLLTYYQEPLLEPAFDRIVATLVAGGALIVGAHERLPQTTVPLIRDPRCPLVYRRALS